MAIQRGDRQRGFLAGRRDQRRVHAGLTQMLPEQTPERVAAHPPQETRMPAQPRQPHHHIARYATGPGVELLSLPAPTSLARGIRSISASPAATITAGSPRIRAQ
jgi:hypothetical protein